MKITVVGAGHVGATLAQRIVDNELANEVALIDIVEGMTMPTPKIRTSWSLPPVYRVNLECPAKTF